MTFRDFCLYLSKIEATAKRLEMTWLLSELLKQADSQEVDKVVMLALGRLAPLYRDIDFGLAEKMVVRAIALANDARTEDVTGEFKKSGDLGETTAKFKVQSSCLAGRQAKFKVTVKSPKLSVTEVFNRLINIANESGSGSQERKIEKTGLLLSDLDSVSAKYVVRIILGNLRLGFSDKTVLDGLSVMIAGDKSARDKLEAAYNVRPDVGWLAEQVKNQIARRVKRKEIGVEKLEWKESKRKKEKIPSSPSQSILASRPQPLSLSISVTPQPGVPIMPALCQRLPAVEEIIEKMSRPLRPPVGSRAVAVEPKWDGQRIQAHVRLNPQLKVKSEKLKVAGVYLFTRSLEDVTEMFPDLVAALKAINNQQLTINNCILDGEVVGIDPKTGKTLPFQTMITRKRKYGIQEKLMDVPVKYMIFDILYLNGKSLMNEEFSDRRKLLEKLKLEVRSENVDHEMRGAKSKMSVLEIAPQIVTDNPIEIRKFLHQQIEQGLEGIVAKRMDAPYIPGRTQFAWVKLKWEGRAKAGGLLDTVDCVVMGTYAGRGKRAGFGVGAFLVGIAAQEKSDIRNHKSYFQTIYKTISKIGTGLTDEQWRELKVKSEKLKVKSQPKEYEVPKELTPDVWLRPQLVVEIQADNITKSPLHTAGYALRFPRLVRYRSDKRADQVTTVGEVKRLYQMQH